jgi:hypothetical protein
LNNDLNDPVAASMETANRLRDPGAAPIAPEAIWWNSQVGMPLRDPHDAVSIDLEGLAYEALVYSDDINALRTVPLSAAKEICIAESEFDAKAFVDSKFRDTSDPVSDTLQTGGPARLNEHRWGFDGGLRQKLTSGAITSLSQQLGHNDSNSLFFVPKNQGTARLALNVTQPLLRAAGWEYNRSLVVLATLDARLAGDEFRSALDKHLLDISQAYWLLYAQRSGVIQRQQSFERVARLAKELEARKIMDSTTSQIIRVRAAMARRKADLLRNQTGIRNTESLLVRLTNSPTLAGGPEVIPLELPNPAPPQLEVRMAIAEAMRHRPEVDAAFQAIRAANVQLNISKRTCCHISTWLSNPTSRGWKVTRTWAGRGSSSSTKALRVTPRV